ncbi:hypothetical protein [Nocardioides dilutus]
MRTRLPALAAAGAASLALFAACADPETDDADPDASESPTASTDGSPTASPTAEPTEEPPSGAGTTMLSTKGLAQGPAPAVPYLVATDPNDPAGTWALVRPAGETLELDVERPFGFATMGNGLVVLADDGDGAAVSILDGTGDAESSEEVRGYRLAVTPDRSIVAWLGTAGQPTAVEGGGARSFDLPEVAQGTELGAILGSGTCKEAEPEGGGCTAFVNADEPRAAYVSTSHGLVDVAGSMLAVVDAAADGRMVGLQSVTDEGSCSGVYLVGDDMAWQTCDHTLTQFAPDATRVLGTDAYLDGFGQRSVAFLDAADGALLHEFTSKGKGPTVLQTAWEDEDHVLAVVYERGRWSVVRLGADGSAELALAPQAGSDLDRPYVLEED